MLSTDAISEVIETGVKSTDFYSVAHEHIFDAIVSLYGSNMPTDAVAVTDYLRNRGLLQETKGPTYTHFLIGFVASPASSAYYATIILEHAQRRALIQTGRKISELGYKPTEDVNGLLGEAQTLLDVNPRKQHQRRHLPTIPRCHGSNPRRNPSQLKPPRRRIRGTHRIHRLRRPHRWATPRADDRSSSTPRCR